MKKSMRRRSPYRQRQAPLAGLMRVHECLRFFKQHSYHTQVELMEYRAMVQLRFKRKIA